MTLLFLLCLQMLFAVPCGDVNSSGSIDIVDALLTAQYYVGLNPQDFDQEVADVNEDGTIDIVDALRIAQYYVGLIPTLPECVPAIVTYELQAETEATWNDGVIESDHEGYTGSGFVNTVNADGSWIEWNINVSSASSAVCVFTYAHESGDRPMEVSLNGSVVTSLSFPGTGAWTSWSTETASMNLVAGSNTIRLTATSINGASNMDKMDITITEGGIVTPTPTATPTATPTSDPNQTPGPTTPPMHDSAWIPDLGDGTYKNPVIYADYSDPDIIKVGSDFYMTASSFNCVPGLPVLHSKDLVNWTLIGHALQKQLPEDVFDKPQHGKGVWAPSIRYHDNQYWIFWGNPDYGIYMVKSANPAGPWEPAVLVLSGKGMIDTCPIWDDDGNAYLVNAWAKSRVGYNSILTLRRMRTDGTGFLDNGTKIFDGNNGVAPTIEGPKFYKKNGYYYIFAPAGGVANGWQVVLRSSDIYGPYQIRTVMEKGNTNINGPHQGGYVELDSGESWFMHFQQVGTYGRLVHLNPLVWRSDNWPVIGNDPDGNGTGNPVSSYRKPDVGGTYPVQIPQTSDDFTSETLGFQWQWQANPKPGWLSLTDRSGYLRLYSQPQASSLSATPNLLLQKLSSESFTVTTNVILNANLDGEKAGLIVISNYAYIAVQRESGNQYMINSNSGNTSLQGNSAYLRITVSAGPRYQFSYSTDGQNFRNLGSSFTADASGWIGAKVGLFSLTPQNKTNGGYADFEFFRFD